MLLKLEVHLLELLERGLVVLTRALGKNIHSKVGFLHFLLVVSLVRLHERVASPFKFLISVV